MATRNPDTKNITRDERRKRQQEENPEKAKTLDGKSETVHCPSCQRDIHPRNFYSVNKDNPSYKISPIIQVCKDCLNLACLNEETKKLDFKRVQGACQTCQIPYEENVIKTYIKNDKLNFGNYKKDTALKSSPFYGYTYDTWELKKINETTPIVHTEENGFEEDEVCDFIVTRDVRQFWGNGFEKEGYEYLEAEISSWKTTHKCDNRAEQTLLKEICIKLWDIRKKRESGDNNVSKEQKELQDLMKTASVDPAKANVASAGKSQDAFGVWIKDIEEKKPAEWWEDQEKYKDMDGFLPYIKNYIVRPIENFMAGVRNFFVDDNIDVDLDSVDVGDKNE